MAAALAFVCALIAVVLMMGWLRRANFTPFVIYRVIAGIAILVWVYAG
jgi:undecaprenyl-diphosphatase